MRLLIATPLYPPESGGPATYSKLLEEGLPHLGIEITVVKFRDVRHLPKVIRHLAYFIRLIREGKENDAVLVLDPVSTGLPAALAAMFLKKPLTVKVVGDYAWEQGKQRFGVTESLDDFAHLKIVPFQVRILRSIEYWVARRSTSIIVPSEYLKKHVTSWGIPPEKIQVIHNAVTLAEEGKVPEEMLRLPHPRILTIARLVPWKGIDKLIEAVAKVREGGKNASLIIVGDGPERSQLETHAREKLQDGFVFTGSLPPEDVRAILRESDVFALNSTYEGLSHVLIEALAAGLPIVATRAGGNAEVVTEDSGILIPVGDTNALADAIDKVILDPEISTRLREGALKRSQLFSVPVMLARTKELIVATI
ncbi:MAG TPA: glycosyltransferase family 4 protein [Candidatus Paceibacterota bacterium]